MSKNFLYQINFNRNKYPEICDRLEEAKNSPNGIAWYIRELVRRDIEEPREKIVVVPKVSAPKNTEYNSEDSFDISGGFA